MQVLPMQNEVRERVERCLRELVFAFISLSLYTVFFGLGGRGNAENAGQEKHRKNHPGSYFGTQTQTCE